MCTDNATGVGSEGRVVPTTPSFRLDGQRALVSGAGRGIGFALAAALAQAGAHVTLWARSADEVAGAADALCQAGGRADWGLVDVTDVAQVQGVLAASEPYDIFVNNAGTNRPRPFVETTEEDFDAIMGLNVRAAYFTAQAVARGMIAAGRSGSIINVSSQAGHVGAAGRSVYTVSKFAVEGMTKVMALELAPYGIRVNSLCPTFIETEMTRPALTNAAFKEFVLSRIKLGRLGQVEDLMGAVVFLASRASALVTGSALVVDGGWTAE